jgi:hypothetical protein
MATDGSDPLGAANGHVPVSDAVWMRAQADLFVPTDEGRSDPTVWERSARIARLAVSIAALPEMEARRVDRNALVVAALYHDIGWVLQVRNRELARAELLTRPTNDNQRELAASFVQTHLGELLGDVTAHAAAYTIRECGHKMTRRAEAVFLAEAMNLDDIGPQAMCFLLRRAVAEGKGIEAVLDAWNRQQEYRYWEARLKECFRFETTRELARRRLEALERLMEDVRRFHRLEDVAELIVSPSSNGHPLRGAERS